MPEKNTKTFSVVWGNVTAPIALSFDTSPGELRGNASVFKDDILKDGKSIFTTADFRGYMAGLGIPSQELTEKEILQAGDVYCIDVQTFGEPIKKRSLVLDFFGELRAPIYKMHRTENGCVFDVYELNMPGFALPAAFYGARNGCNGNGEKSCSCLGEYARQDSLERGVPLYFILSDKAKIEETSGLGAF